MPRGARLIMKHKLQELLEDAFKVRSYSGRGMYGATCLAVTTDDGLAEVVAHVVLNVDDENRHDVARALRRMKTDSMGLGMVVYFPGVPFEGDDSDDDDDTDDEGES